MTSESLLETLGRSGLIADDVLTALRRQVAAAGGRLDAPSIVRQLIEAGHLTKAQGERLLGAPAARPHHATIEVEPDDELEVLDDDDQVTRGNLTVEKRVPDDLEVLPDDDDLLPPPPPPARKSPAPAPAKPAPPPSISQKETRAADNDDLGLAPLDDDPLLSSPLRKPGKQGSPASGKSPDPLAPGKPAKRKRRMWRNEVAPAAPELANQVDDLLGGGKGSESLVAAAEGRRNRAPVPRGPRNVWDSPLLLIGGGSLIGLLILGAVLLFVTRRQTGDQAFDVAEEAYKSGSYSTAIGAFDQYLLKYPKHGSASTARVHRGLCEMRAASESTRDWTKVLDTAKTTLNQISPELEFPTAQADLASILPAIAAGLAAQAREKPSAELVAQAKEAVALVDKFVPVTLQPTEQLREISASLALTTRNLERDKSLDAAVSEMRAAAQSGKLLDVYAIRHKLLQTYPELADTPKLMEEMVAAAENERAAVKFVAEDRAAETTDATPATLASVALTATTGKPAPLEDGDLAPVLDSGSAYGLDARTGRPRWRRFVGYDTDFVPQVVKTSAGRAALLFDAVQQSVVLIDATTGKLRWRQPIDDAPAASPKVVRDRVLIGSHSGKLRFINLETGQLSGFVQIPQPLRVPPVVDLRERLYYQVAEQANLYVLAAEGGECREVFYLGHEPESIAAPPVLVERYLILVVNRGAEDSALRILLADEDGLHIKAVEQAPLRGHVFSPPVVSGRALLVGTDRGALYSFELGPPDSGRILTKLAEKPADDKEPIVPFLAARGAELWLGGYGVTRYDVQASRGALAPKWINDDQSVVLHAPLVMGAALVYATRGSSSPGAVANAINGTDGSRFWETRLGVPLAAPPIVAAEASKAIAMTSAGALFEVPAAGMASRKLMDAPVAGSGEKISLATDQQLVELDDGRCVFSPRRANATAGIAELLIYDPKSADNKLRRAKLPQPAAARPVSYAGGLLVPTKIGQVALIDPDTGRQLIEPFQPVVEVGRDIAWTDPTVYGDKQVLISDGQTKLYRLATADAPRAHLEAAATLDLATPLVTAAAVAGDFAYAVDAGNRLLSFRLPDLKPGDDWPLDARAVWGPQRVGDQVLVASMSGQLACADATGKLLWQAALGPENIIVGSPLVSRGAIVACASSGTIYRLAPDSGNVLSQTALGQPLALGPVLWHERLLCAGSDGTLHVVAEPK